MADSRHTTKAAAAPQEGHSQTTTGDPVVELSRELLRLWDADDSAQRELDSAASASVKVDTQVEFGEWRDAVETIIGFSQAASLEGALIQRLSRWTPSAISFAGTKASLIVGFDRQYTGSGNPFIPS
jgi:hypothetical protein